jgi:hypothetical protein
MALRTVQFLVIVFTALALVPAGAHLFALPNKIGMEEAAYITAQQIYAGWALLGIVLIGALVLNLIHAIMVRGEYPTFRFALAAFLLVAATLAIFFTWTFPANQVTANWTEAPQNWEALRTQWEYSHAANAVLTFLALCCVTLAVLTKET